MLGHFCATSRKCPLDITLAALTLLLGPLSPHHYRPLLSLSFRFPQDLASKVLITDKAKSFRPLLSLWGGWGPCTRVHHRCFAIIPLNSHKTGSRLLFPYLNKNLLICLSECGTSSSIEDLSALTDH